MTRLLRAVWAALLKLATIVAVVVATIALIAGIAFGGAWLFAAAGITGEQVGLGTLILLGAMATVGLVGAMWTAARDEYRRLGR